MSINLRRAAVSIAIVFLLAGSAGNTALAQPQTDVFFVTLSPAGEAFNWGGSGYEGGTWFWYPNTSWWNVWFNNMPAVPFVEKTIHLELDIQPIGPAPFLEIVYNWSTLQWTELGLGRPPLPSDVPIPFLEEMYIVRSEPVFVGPVTAPLHLIHDFSIFDCPEWISIDIRGASVQLMNGAITHECQLTPFPCLPTPDMQACEPVMCPMPNEVCLPTRVRVFYAGPQPSYQILTCECLDPTVCHTEIIPPAQVFCSGNCPADQICVLDVTDNADGSKDFECRCVSSLVGACCYGIPPTQCLVTNEFDCVQNLAGQYKGDGTDCSDLNVNGVADICEQPQHAGACCSLTNPGACQITDPVTCQQLNGVYVGDGTDCADLDFNGQADICELIFRDVDRGDAPEGSLAYPGLGVIGQFPTCMFVGPAAWIQHTNFGGFLGGGPDYELDGNAGFCPVFTPDTYDRDECFADGDAGLLFPGAFTIQGPVGAEVVAPCPSIPAGSSLGPTCTTATWGSNVDLMVTNFMPSASKGYVNVLIDWDQSGDWSGASPCPTASAPEHMLVNFEVLNGYSGALSGVVPPPPPFLIGPNTGYVWARFMFSERQVPPGWTGEGFYEDGETEDYLLLIGSQEGACCFGDPPTQCTVTDRMTCEQVLLGQYMGDNTDCADLNSNGVADVCEASEPQACCLSDGNCIMATPADCLAQAGTPQGAGMVCTGILIPCCLPDGTCVMVEPQCCDELNGVPSPTGQSMCLGDQNQNGVDDACEQPQPVMACCLRNGTCVDIAYNDCVQQGGDPQGPTTDCSIAVCHPLKWAQPPLFDPSSPHPECFWGWDEPSIYGGFQIVADDWLCVGPQPVTNIHWWGSYINWDGIEPPPDAPARFHIGIWTDVPALPPMPSHPGVMIWQGIVHRGQLNERPVACDFHPLHMQSPEGCFRYDFLIPQEEWFWQPPSPIETIYWISISAIYEPTLCPCNGDINGDGIVDAADQSMLLSCMGQPPVGQCANADLDCNGLIDPNDIPIFLCWFNCTGDFDTCQHLCCPMIQPQPEHLWGWKSRLHFFNDDGFGVTMPNAPLPGSQFESGHVISEGWDFAFVLTTQTEACCLADGTCLDVMPADCLAVFNGVPQGPGTSCANMMPVIVQQPASVEACAGGPVTLSVVACGHQAFTYQWWRAGTPPTPVGNNSELKWLSVQMSDAGGYYVDVTDPSGNTVQSASATLTVFMTGSGDIDGNGVLNGLDVQPFVDAFLNGSPPLKPWCAADMDADGDVDTDDVPLFVSALLNA